MIKTFPVPDVVISRCIEFDPVRYDGTMIRSEEVADMKKFVRFIPVCPEVEIGLGIPRETLRIIRTKEGDRLFQPATGMDLTDDMNKFSEKFISELSEVDGFIMKNKSPTSGIANVKIYPGIKNANIVDKGEGVFGGAVLAAFPGYPVEDEGRIRNFRILDHFLTRVFLLAGLREIEKKSSAALSEFHHKNKTLLMAFNQDIYRIMGRAVSGREMKDEADLYNQYKGFLITATQKPIRFTANINAMMHAFGQVSQDLSKGEKEFFLHELEAYRRGEIPALAIKGLLKSWAVRFENTDILNQSYFEPYPLELAAPDNSMTERGKEYSFKG